MSLTLTPRLKVKGIALLCIAAIMMMLSPSIISAQEYQTMYWIGVDDEGSLILHALAQKSSSV
ncbi:MAG: hypothetical protein ACXQTI_09560 [Candidatus Nezhaarchaeales archaeon]